VRRGKDLVINGKKVAVNPTPQTSKKKKVFKYGVEVPQNWADIIRIDGEAGNWYWQDAVAKEVAALLFHECFVFQSPDYKPSEDYQYV